MKAFLYRAGAWLAQTYVATHGKDLYAEHKVTFWAVVATAVVVAIVV